MDALPPAHALYEPIIAEDTGDDPNATDRPSINDVETSSDPSLEYDEEFETLVVVLMKNQDRVDVNQAAMNITYTIINAGLIALPFVAYNAGIPLFIAVVVCVALLSSYVAVMVIAMANEKRAPTLEDLAEVVGGVNFFLFVCAIQVLFSLSMMVCSLDVWADVMADVFRNYVDADVLGMRRCQVLIGGLIVLPLCLFKKSMVSLRWTAYFTVFAVAACVAAVAATYLSKQSVGTTTAQALQPKSQWWTVIYVIVFCFSYNQRVFAVHRCLRSKGGERRVERWKHAVCRATVGVTAMYIIFGVAGFLSMARMGIDADQFNYFLDDQGENKIVYDVSRVVVVSSLLLTIPVDCLIASSTWRRLYQRYFRRNKSRTLPTLPPSPASSPLASLAPSTFDTDGEEGDVGKERSSLSERDERDSVTTTSTVCNRVPSREEMVAILRANSLENVRQ
ncbi:transmembrane amino acid transporter protein-domain-containing protein, partial [Ochromonadaceae sp. CCMP2298]